ncbi:MAG: hypothetical protein QHH80_04660 [Anaerolineae bacterium]|nr:hypothetical protein [Anaerolineae bacterium]
MRVVIAITSRAVITGAGWTEVVRRRLNAVSSALDDARLRLGAMWRLYPPRGLDILRWPVVRGFSQWFERQEDYMQVALLAFSLAMAFLLIVAAGYIGLRPPAALTAKAEAPTDLAAVLYEWKAQQPALPATKCDPHTPQETCWRQLMAGAEEWQADFAEYVAAIQAKQRYAAWTHEGKDFPTYNRDTGVITFTLALEGPVRADEKTCLPFRVIAQMPAGITTGPWSDQEDQAKPSGDIRQRLRDTGVKPKPFPHPCLRTTNWTAWVRIEPATAQSWAARAKEKGWKLEMFFRLHEAESPLLSNWDEDGRLTDGDFLKEQRIWVWVDEVRLLIGDQVVYTWR